MQNFIAKAASTAAGAFLAMQPGLAQAAVSHICPELDPSSKTLSVRIGSGCMTGMARFRDHDLQVKVDQHRAHISVTGDIRFHPIGGRVVTADCGGAKSFTLSSEGIEPRRYTLSYAGNYVGVADFLADAKPQECFGTMQEKVGVQTQSLSTGEFADWRFDLEEQWNGWRGNSVTALLEPLLGGAPQSLEGRPEIDVRMEKRMWHPSAAGMSTWAGARTPFIAVWITRHGLADDSVTGDRYFVAAVQGDDGWRVDKVWSQQMCARGENAGQWTGASCP
ncbi:MAG: hypothetical protein WBA51_16640 [Erythrobacter sp.]